MQITEEPIYHASESSGYRVLKSAEQVNHRRRAQPVEKRYKPTSQRATMLVVGHHVPTFSG